MPCSRAVEVGGEEGEQASGVERLSRGVGVGLAVGGEQSEGAEGADLDLDLAPAGFEQQRGESIFGRAVVQAGQGAEFAEGIQGQVGDEEQALVGRACVGAPCLPLQVGHNKAHGLLSRLRDIGGRLGVAEDIVLAFRRCCRHDSRLWMLSRKRGKKPSLRPPKERRISWKWGALRLDASVVTRVRPFWMSLW